MTKIYFLFAFWYFVRINILKSGVLGGLIEKPKDTALRAGSEVRFYCQTDLTELQWLYYTPGSNIQHIVYTAFEVNPKLGPRYSLKYNDSGGDFYLKIVNVALADAGLYVCEETGTAVTAQAQLTVLASDPDCTTNVSAKNTDTKVQFSVIEFDHIVMSCTVNYSGNWPPVMSWQRDGGAVITDGVVNNTVAYKSVTYSLTVLATRNNNRYMCVTHFRLDNRPSHHNASFSQKYNYTWISPFYEVQFSPRHLTVTPARTNYRFGEKITCSAEGNPEPSYQWKDLTTGNTFNGAELLVARSLRDSNEFTFQCTATNRPTAGGSLGSASRNISFTATDLDVGVYVGLGSAAGVIIFLAVLATVVGCVIRKRNKPSQSYEQTILETRDIPKPSVYAILTERHVEIGEDLETSVTQSGSRSERKRPPTPPSSSETDSYINC